ncbi:MAG: hypothetical protein ISR60_07560, partial [Anaerolineales bacterium]|nr:hypothetical protein [Anaerolineales bacterium]
PHVAFDASGASDVEQLSSDAISPGVESEPAEEAEPVEKILPEQSPVIPDPYFFVGGTKHSFLPEGGDCAGAENCTVSTTPIQDALNVVSGGLTPDDGTIYIEGGIYTEDVSISNFANLTLQGSANGSTSILSGNVEIHNSQAINLYNFIFEEVLQIADADEVSIVGTDGDDEIEVAVEGVVDNLSVDGAAGNDTITINQNADSSTVKVDGGSGDDELTVNATADADQITQESNSGPPPKKWTVRKAKSTL